MKFLRSRASVLAVILGLVALPALGQATAPPAPAVAAPAAPAVATYAIDPVHSELTFRVRHLLGRVAGTFRDWSGTIVMNTAEPAKSSVTVEVKTASIETLKAE